MTSQTFKLYNGTDRRHACNVVTTAPEGYVCEVRPPKRTNEQNDLLHALFTDIAKSGFQFGGCARDKDEVKVIFVSAHAIATGRQQEVIQGLEGEPVALRESTARMSKERLSSLVEYVLAWCAQNNVNVRVPT